jgi:hypothetical protein
MAPALTGILALGTISSGILKRPQGGHDIVRPKTCRAVKKALFRQWKGAFFERILKSYTASESLKF